MKADKIGVHRAHCCRLHGCKYGDEDCPVAKGEVNQFFPCEACGQDGIFTLSEVFAVVGGKAKTCPHCGHLLK